MREDSSDLWVGGRLWEHIPPRGCGTIERVEISVSVLRSRGLRSAVTRRLQLCRSGAGIPNNALRPIYYARYRPGNERQGHLRHCYESLWLLGTADEIFRPR